MTFAVGDDVRIMEVSREGLTGRGMELREFPGRLRGHLGPESVDLVLAAPRITGSIGNHVLSLDMLPGAGGMRVAGHFGEREIALFIRTEGIDGQVGPCCYHLELKMGKYAGQIRCVGEPEDVRLEVPVAFAAKSDAEVTALLVSVLAR